MAHANFTLLAKKILDALPPLAHRIRQEMRAEMGHSLTVAQFRILMRLSRQPHTLGGLAKHHEVSTATMSRTMSGLIDRGLVSREISAGDRRSATLSLTPQGWSLLEKFKSAAGKRITRSLRHLSRAELLELNRGLKAMMKITEHWEDAQ